VPNWLSFLDIWAPSRLCDRLIIDGPRWPPPTVCVSRMNPAGSDMNFLLTFSTAVGSRNRMQKYLFVGVGALIRRNEDIHFPEPLIRYGSL
jgi:hypothetical protein